MKENETKKTSRSAYITGYMKEKYKDLKLHCQREPPIASLRAEDRRPTDSKKGRSPAPAEKIKAHTRAQSHRKAPEGAEGGRVVYLYP